LEAEAEDHSLRLAGAKLMRPKLKNKQKNKRTCSMAQMAANKRP
jgi:hypothetical protein